MTFQKHAFGVEIVSLGRIYGDGLGAASRVLFTQSTIKVPKMLRDKLNDAKNIKKTKIGPFLKIFQNLAIFYTVFPMVKRTLGEVGWTNSPKSRVVD